MYKRIYKLLHGRQLPLFHKFVCLQKDRSFTVYRDFTIVQPFIEILQLLPDVTNTVPLDKQQIQRAGLLHH